MTVQAQIQKLDQFTDHENTEIAEYAQVISNYAQAVATGRLSREEYSSLIGDISVLQKMGKNADEQRQVVQIYEISRLILSLL